jgi:CRP/FNR family transcriptional regulator, cyclic AMP receptor protein
MKQPDPLPALPLFQVMKAADRRRLARELKETRYRKGEYIFREGDPADYFHILKEGTVKCVKSSAEGSEITVKVLMPGDLFCCDASVFDGGPHPGCAMCLDDAKVWRLDKKAYFDMLRRNPDVAVEVIRYLGHRLNEAQENAKVLTLDKAEQRLASLLVDLVRRSSKPEGTGFRLTVHLTREDLANMVGIRTETAIRIMSQFKRNRLVAGTAKRLIILDLPQLQRVASLMPA